MPEPYFVSVILLAGGNGTRMGTQTPKQYLPLANKLLAQYSFELFAQLPCVKEIIVVCEERYQPFFLANTSSLIDFAPPGNRRQDSVWNGLCRISEKSELVCVHDSARPLLRKEHCLAVLREAHLHGAAVLGVPVKNTIKSANDGFVKKTLDRSTLWEVQTPQVIRPDWLYQGFAKALELQDLSVSDDASLIELLGYQVKLVLGTDSNIKITTPTDFALAESLLRAHEKNQTYPCL